jgi:hypothetical protein
MTRPLKKTGYNQSIYEISAVQKERIGLLRVLSDGRKFRYAKAGASALGMGKFACAAPTAAAVINKACPTSVPVGTRSVALTIASATYAMDYFNGGYLQINDTGAQYEITGSTAVSSGTAITISLEDPIKIALTSSMEFTLVQSPWMATVELASGTLVGTPAGVSPMDVTAAYFYWAQTGGIANCLEDGTPAAGQMLCEGTTAGALTIMNTTFNPLIPFVAYQGMTVGVNGHYKPVFLMID